MENIDFGILLANSILKKMEPNKSGLNYINTNEKSLF